MSCKYSIIIGTILGMTSVIMGAFGAHYLESFLDSDAIKVFETGARFQMYHAFLLIIVGLMQHSWPSRVSVFATIFISVGILIFSGSLYVIALSGISMIGAITPVGGLSLIIGWALLILSAVLLVKSKPVV